MASNNQPPDLTKASTEATTRFVDDYYTTLQTGRTNISTYYVPPQAQPSTSASPSILWNGTPFTSGADFQTLFTDSMPLHLFYDIAAADCSVLNPCYSTDARMRADRNFSMVVTTSGHLRMEDRKTGPLKEFSETFVLVPNVEKLTAGGGPKGGRRREWLIQMQNFRYVVEHHPSLIEGQVAMDME